MEAATNIAYNLASALVLAGAGRVRDEALGEEQERALKDVIQRAADAMLVEIARTGVGNQEMVERYGRQFRKFFGDPWAAETLLGVALASEPPPVDRLRARFSQVGFDPDALPIGFDRAMAVFVVELARRLEEEATKGGTVAALVNRSDLRAMRDSVEDLARERGSTGPDADELERASRARRAERWRAVGLPEEEAFALADDPVVGAPGPALREALGRPVSVLVGEVGAGKSLTLDRIFQRAVVRLREETDAPLPAFVEAWEVEGSLEDEVVRKTSSLGDPRRRGATILVDGAEEAGRSRAGRLLTEARRLAHTWPNTTVIIAGRPVPELTGDFEHVGMPNLTEGETKALIERVSGQEFGPMETHGWPASVAEAVRRPFFATLVGLDVRERDFRNPRSTAELLSGLVDRALERADEAVELDQLRLLAVASIDRGGGPVRTSDVATTVEARRLRATGLVSERNGAVAFSLQILNEWFAAQALEAGLVDPSELASDLARLERWRYPLAIAAGTFGYARVKEILGPVAKAAPGFASQLVEEGLARSGFGDDEPLSTLPEEFGEQLRSAMQAWVEGIGSLAPLIAPVLEDGSLSTLGLDASEERVYRRAWYRGQEELAEVVDLSDHLPEGHPDRDWPNIRGVGSYRQAAWVWRYSLEDLRSDLSRLLKKRRLPVSGGLLVEEAAWEAARYLDRSFGGQRRPEREPVPLESLDECFETIGEFGDEDPDEIHVGSVGGEPRVYDLRSMKREVRRLRAAGATGMSPPWPTPDRLGDPGLRRTETGSVHVWELYSPEALLAKARIVLEGALEAYRRFVEEYFGGLAPHMQIAATLPARLTGTLILSHVDRRMDIRPYVAWHLDPLPPGSENEIVIEIGKERATRRRMLAILDRVREMRPEAAGWISSPEYATSEFFWRTPATELAYELLWKDLERISWVDGMFNRRFL